MPRPTLSLTLAQRPATLSSSTRKAPVRRPTGRAGTLARTRALVNTSVRPPHRQPRPPCARVRVCAAGAVLFLAGFGNLAGEVAVWSREPLKHLGTIAAADVTVMEWCPDGRHLLGATLSPRLRVDNGVRLWHYRGALISRQPFAELFQVAWRPMVLPARPLSPAPAASASAGASASSAVAAAPSPTSVMRAAYVPPHLRAMQAVRRSISRAEPASGGATGADHETARGDARGVPWPQASGQPAAQQRKLYDLVGESVDTVPAAVAATDGPCARSRAGWGGGTTAARP